MLDATERKALVLSTFAAACICFAPGQIVSGLFLLTLSVGLWRWDLRVLAREAAARSAAEAKEEAPPPPAEAA